MDLLNDNEEDKSRIFFGSSAKHEELAKALIEILGAENNIVCCPWRNISEISEISFLLALFREFKKCDFAVFIFGPDDEVIRDKLGKEEIQVIARDNVIFETGFSMGKITEERTFLVTPNDIENFHLPSDISGFYTATYSYELSIKKQHYKKLRMILRKKLENYIKEKRRFLRNLVLKDRISKIFITNQDLLMLISKERKRPFKC